MARRIFTREDDVLLLALCRHGLTKNAISQLTGVNPSSLYKRIQVSKANPPTPAEMDLAQRKVHEMTAPDRDRTAEKKNDSVRCLGGCGKLFHSPDRLRIRICPDCKRRHQQNGGMPTHEYRVFSSNEPETL